MVNEDVKVEGCRVQHLMDRLTPGQRLFCVLCVVGLFIDFHVGSEPIAVGTYNGCYKIISYHQITHPSAYF